MRRLGLLLLLLALLAACPAAAKNGSPFNRASARPGDALVIGPGLFASARVDTWLLPLAQAKRWWPSYNAYAPTYGPRPHLRAAVWLGSIPRYGTISVRVPNVAAGRYVLAYWIPSTQARWTSARADNLPVPGNVLRVRR